VVRREWSANIADAGASLQKLLGAIGWARRTMSDATTVGAPATQSPHVGMICWPGPSRRIFRVAASERSSPTGEAALREGTGRAKTDEGSGQRSSPTGGVWKRFSSFSTTRGTGSAAISRPAAFHPRALATTFGRGQLAKQPSWEKQPYGRRHRACKNGRCRGSPSGAAHGRGVLKRFSSFGTACGTGSAAAFRPAAFHPRPWRRIFQVAASQRSSPTGEAAPAGGPVACAKKKKNGRNRGSGQRAKQPNGRSSPHGRCAQTLHLI
jgi:hypothetical protein